MAFDPFDPKQINRLNKAVRASHRKLESHRKTRKDLVEEYAGQDYVSESHVNKMPVNMLALLIDVYLMHLAGNGPRVILPTPRKDILPYVADLEAIVNQELVDMKLDKVLRRWVLDAIFCMGVLKCGLVDGEYVEILPGEPQPTQDYFVDIVDFDDFVFDVNARSWDKITFIGDRYVADFESVMSHPAYDPNGKRTVRANEEDGEQTADRVSSLGIPDEGDYDEQHWKKQTNLWDICLPEEGIVITLPDSQEVYSPLKVVEWEGPSTSPYHTLFFSEVPGNLMPLAPGVILRSLNRALNALYRKLIRQAERQKTLALFRSSEKDSAERIQKAADGDLVPVEHPDLVKDVSFGGPAQENMGLAIQLRDMFSMLAGNLDAMGGLGPQSDTASQDALIAQTVSQKSAKMSRAVTDATVEVVRDVIFRIWNDPIRTYQTTRRVAGTNVEVEAVLSPGQRFGQLSDIDVKIEPYSMQYRSPQERANEIVGLLTNIVFPMLPFIQQQGLGIDLQKVFELLSKYKDLPELQHIFQFVGTPMPGVAGQEAKQPQVSHRTYERVNRPGATRQGNDQVMQQIFAGGNPQQSQRAAVGRMTGV